MVLHQASCDVVHSHLLIRDALDVEVNKGLLAFCCQEEIAVGLVVLIKSF